MQQWHKDTMAMIVIVNTQQMIRNMVVDNVQKEFDKTGEYRI